jgi:hypothetical protein
MRREPIRHHHPQWIVDGARRDAFEGDVAAKDGIIAAVGRTIAGEADEAGAVISDEHLPRIRSTMRAAIG